MVVEEPFQVESALNRVVWTQGIDPMEILEVRP